MTAAAFDASAYRRTVLTPLRSASPATVQDVFWLGDVPRDVDDDAEITARLASTKAFLHKERSRPRQADVAAAVLKEWSRVEGVLGDAAARAALRARLDGHAPGAEVVVGGGAPAGSPATAAGGSGASQTVAAPAGGSAALRLRQVRTALDELARIRDEPELAEDLFAFLGLPVAASSEMVRARVALVGDANRKRRADRERSLVDELLMHSRELLIDGDPAAYRAATGGDLSGYGSAAEPTATAAPTVNGAPAPESAPTPAVDIPESFVTDDGTVVPVSPPPWNGPTPGPATGRIDYSRRPKATPSAESTPDERPPAVARLEAQRDATGALVVTWDWPEGVTEAFVVIGAHHTPDGAPAPSRKVTNTKYEIDGGARFEGVDPGITLAVFSGRRDQAGRLTWSTPASAPATIAP